MTCELIVKDPGGSVVNTLGFHGIKAWREMASCLAGMNKTTRGQNVEKVTASYDFSEDAFSSFEVRFRNGWTYTITSAG